jgi:hypothetical protein
MEIVRIGTSTPRPLVAQAVALLRESQGPAPLRVIGHAVNCAAIGGVLGPLDSTEIYALIEESVVAALVELVRATPAILRMGLLATDLRYDTVTMGVQLVFHCLRRAKEAAASDASLRTLETITHHPGRIDTIHRIAAVLNLVVVEPLPGTEPPAIRASIELSAVTDTVLDSLVDLAFWHSSFQDR